MRASGNSVKVPEGLKERPRAFVLCEEAIGSGKEGRLADVFFPGDNEDPDMGISSFDLSGGFNPGEGRHVLIHEDYVGLKLV